MAQAIAIEAARGRGVEVEAFIDVSTAGAGATVSIASTAPAFVATFDLITGEAIAPLPVGVSLDSQFLENGRLHCRAAFVADPDTGSAAECLIELSDNSGAEVQGVGVAVT